MKTKEILRKLAEPFAYLVLVAAFGFITTLANHTDRDLVNQTERDQLSRDSELVTLILENGIDINENETINYKEPTEIKL